MPDAWRARAKGAALLLALLAIAVLTQAGALAPVLAGNINAVRLTRILSAGPDQPTASHYPVLPALEETAPSAALLDLPVAGRPWLRGRIALMQGQSAAADRLLSGLPAKTLRGGSMAGYDQLLAESLHAPDLTLARLNAGDIAEIPAPVRDQLILAQTDALAKGNGNEPAEVSVARAQLIRYLRPNDLFAAFLLAAEFSDRLTPAGLTEASQRLKHNDADAILPLDERLTPWVYAVIPELYRRGLWDRWQTAAALELVSDGCRAPQHAVRAVEQLAQIEPSAGEWKRALTRLASCRPGDSSDAGEGRPNVSPVADGEQVAAMLGAPEQPVTFGPELIANGDFEATYGRGRYPEWWLWGCPQMADPTDALFIGGPNRSAAGVHIVGLWKTAAFAGVCGFYQSDQYAMQARDIALPPSSTYLLTLDYRTQSLGDNEAGLHIASSPGVFYDGALGLPATGGAFRRLYLLGANPQEAPASIRLLLYGRALGRVDFSGVSLRQVQGNFQGPGVTLPVTKVLEPGHAAAP